MTIVLYNPRPATLRAEARATYADLLDVESRPYADQAAAIQGLRDLADATARGFRIVAKILIDEVQ